MSVMSPPKPVAPATLTPQQATLLADKTERAAARAEAAETLAANPGPVVAAAPLPTAPVAVTAKPQIVGFVKPRAMAVVEAGLTPGCLADDAGHNESVSAWNADAVKYAEAKAHCCDNPETVTVEQLATRREAINRSELTLSQRAVLLQREFVERATIRAGELKTFRETCDEGLVETEKAVVVKLNAAGVSVESQPAYPDNGEAAKVAFSHLVRQSSEWQAANAKAGTAVEQHQAAVAEVTTGKARVADAEAALATVVKRLAGC
ncbi:hypothetical protein [Lacipirellula parvula]|uniref:Uncharacterized protein n=1 Tax=Lacipirellula parvula TaxID=2650471 RepID=A0A5K7XDU0_9BACT|nr:hypothetical protein [Lacipirellula parvula]BBO32506.1 hypothetical protein PLANPX_2118 [Lacipirellula parvula]